MTPLGPRIAMSPMAFMQRLMAGDGRDYGGLCAAPSYFSNTISMNLTMA